MCLELEVKRQVTQNCDDGDRCHEDGRGILITRIPCPSDNEKADKNREGGIYQYIPGVDERHGSKADCHEDSQEIPVPGSERFPLLVREKE